MKLYRAFGDTHMRGDLFIAHALHYGIPDQHLFGREERQLATAVGGPGESGLTAAPAVSEGFDSLAFRLAVT